MSTTTRRAFIQRSAGMLGGIVVAAGVLPFAGCESITMKNPVTPDNNSGLTIDGTTVRIDTAATAFVTLKDALGYVALDVLSKKILVIRLSETSASSISRVCTHQGCDINAQEAGTLASDQFICPCHGSRFQASTGAVLKGPAPIGVQRFPATIAGSFITVDLS